MGDSGVEVVVSPKSHEVGGFLVRRALPTVRRRSIGPFVFVDHMGPTEPQARFSVPPHPHIGISTLTYLFEGEVRHRDSLGTDQKIVPGDVNWMTAGRGIVHAEDVAPQYSGRFHGMQFWVALPSEHEEDEPSFEHQPSTALSELIAEGTGVTLVAGRGLGLVSPLKVHSSLVLAAVRMVFGATFSAPAEHSERALYLLSGSLSVSGHTFAAPALIVLRPGEPVTVKAEAPVLAMFFGGDPLEKRRYMDWNFVSSRKERLLKAREDYRSGLLGRLQEVGQNLPHPEDVE